MSTDERFLLAQSLIALGLAVDRLRVGITRELELTPQQVQLLCALDHGPRPSGDLAVLLACDKTNITGLVNRLEPRGLVDRVRDESDRRVVRIELTAAGQAVVDQFRSRAATAFADSLDGWSPDQVRKLTAAAHDAVRALGPDLLIDEP